MLSHFKRDVLSNVSLVIRLSQTVSFAIFYQKNEQRRTI
ncbi:hypothetical protein SDSE_0707 [Streptococcus dysgalactiae subsp. equisimilis AC-2713]|uniref:Uncharacterized protein n=1 Tax=Streptococcus dysgalactiae subsp. equisimilis AC-2713 TaxID=759913 RepID=A0AB33R603_STREQ|nr:hypothetical protein HMPREF9964_0031 [Streptococcus dysgalactiae subsp. equisimilis SK1249]CCI62205.1 hypothetical protein SDSE_0707 [Streptococcus dysgalactiae subsp. equisimilis AC-2713]